MGKKRKKKKDVEKYKCGCPAEGSRLICRKHFEPLDGLEPEVAEAQDIAHEQALAHAHKAYVKACTKLEEIKKRKAPVDKAYIEIKGKHEQLVAELSLVNIEANAAMSAIAITLQLQSGIVTPQAAAEKMDGITKMVVEKIQRLAPQLQRQEDKK